MEQAIERWLDEAVIGLGLCPFARPVREAGLIRIAVSQATTPEAVLHDLVEEAMRLVETPRSELATTLLVLPHAVREFEDYNDLLDPADAVIDALGLAGTLQLASFHPEYRFQGTEAEDPGNYTNRAPYPILHLLREDDVSDAVADYPDVGAIPERNIARLAALDEATRKRLTRGW